MQLYEFVELFGEWGGYVGIFIGLSFLDIVYWLTGMINQKINSIVDRIKEREGERRREREREGGRERERE